MAATLKQVHRRRGQVGFLFILPLLVYFLIFQLAPILFPFYLFTSWNGRSLTFDFIGFKIILRYLQPHFISNFEVTRYYLKYIITPFRLY